MKYGNPPPNDPPPRRATTTHLRVSIRAPLDSSRRLEHPTHKKFVFRCSGCRDTRRCRIFTEILHVSWSHPHPRWPTPTPTASSSSSQMEKILHLHPLDRILGPRRPPQRGLVRRPRARLMRPLRVRTPPPLWPLRPPRHTMTPPLPPTSTRSSSR
jgi:hypothetical protein